MFNFLIPLGLRGQERLLLMEVLPHLMQLLLAVAQTKFLYSVMALTGRLDKLNLVNGELK